MDKKGGYQDGLNLAPESGLEVARPGQGPYNGPSNLPEVSQGPIWQHANPAGYPPGSTDPYYSQHSLPQYQQQQQQQQQQQNPGYEHSFGAGSPATGYGSPEAEAGGEKMHSEEEGKILGMKRKAFFIALAITALIVVIAIAVGLGVGLATRSNSKDSDKIPTTQSATIKCPDDDNAIYRAKGTDRYFKIFCGIDYNSDDGAVELTSDEAESMAACINDCASRDECTAAGWGNFYGVETCFMKKSIGTSNESGTWIFTKEVDDPNEDE